MDFKIGEVLKKFRLKKGLKGTYVAEVLNIDPSTLSKYESDERQVPIKLLPLFAEIYGCSVGNFFDKNVGETPIKKTGRNSA